MKSQGILHLASHLVLERDSLVVKVFTFQKNPTKILISAGFLAQGFALDGQ